MFLAILMALILPIFRVKVVAPMLLVDVYLEPIFFFFPDLWLGLSVLTSLFFVRLEHLVTTKASIVFVALHLFSLQSGKLLISRHLRCKI